MIMALHFIKRKIYVLNLNLNNMQNWMGNYGNGKLMLDI